MLNGRAVATGRARMCVLGTFALFGPDGKTLTPKGQKARALLALVATSEHGVRARVWLCDKLWSDRGQEQALANLRQTLTQIRKCLGLYADLVQADRSTVRIRLDLIELDLRAFRERKSSQSAGSVLLQEWDDVDFLEGIDVRDPEFEEWLTAERSHWWEARQHLRVMKLPTADTKPSAVASTFQTAFEAQAMAAKVGLAVSQATDAHPLAAPLEPIDALKLLSSSRFRLSVMPVAASGHDEMGELIGDMILSRIVVALKYDDIFDVFDFRENARVEPLGSRAADATLHLRSMTMSRHVFLSFVVRRVGDNAVIWACHKSLDFVSLKDSRVAPIVTQLVDEISSVFFRNDVLGDGDRHLAARYAMDGIDQMFRLAAPNLDAAAVAFSRATEVVPKGSYLAWQAYLMAFKLEESQGRNIKALRERAEELARRALESDPHNPLVLSLVTHVYAFVFRDFARAFSIIAPVRSAKPDCVMFYDSLGMLHFYTGDLVRARQAAEKAAQIGQFNPYRYSFSTSLCMINAVMGDYKAAVYHGEQAFAMQRGAPKMFEPNLRYLCSAYVHLGDHAKAADMLRQLQTQDPGFGPSSFDEEDYPVPAPLARNFLRQGFLRLQHADR